MLEFLAPYKKIIWIVVLCIVGLGVLLYTLQGIDSCRFQSNQEKKKEAVNTALKEISNAETNIAVDKAIANQMAANVKQATEEYLDSINATDQQREEVNKAIANMEKAKQANRNVNAEELERILEGVK